jgi:hypothetical protein
MTYVDAGECVRIRSCTISMLAEGQGTSIISP